MALSDTIYITDRFDDVILVCRLGGLGTKSLVYTDDLLTERVEDGSVTFVFKVPFDHPQTGLIITGTGVIVTGTNGELYHMVVSKTAEVAGGDRYVEVTCEGSWLELNAFLMYPDDDDSEGEDTPTYALTAALAGTRWSAGKVDKTDERPWSWLDYPTRLACVQDIAGIWDLEPEFVVTMDGGQVTSRKVNLLTKRGSRDEDKSFEYNRDMVGAARTGDVAKLFTALVGLGKSYGESEYLDFEDVVWTTPTNPVAKPAGQLWVGDPEALTLYGIPKGDGTFYHRTGVYQNEDMTLDFTEEDLLTKTWEELQKYNHPSYEYEVEAALIDRLPEQRGLPGNPPPIAIGDDVLVRDLTFVPPLILEARILELSRSLANPATDAVTLGEFVDKGKGIVSLDPRALALRVYAGEGPWSTVSSTVVVAAYNSVDKSRADFICDGTDDHVEIQAAIDKLGANGGRVTLLDGGYYFYGHTINVNTPSAITFAGMGSATVLYGGTIDVTTRNCMLKDFVFDNTASNAAVINGISTLDNLPNGLPAWYYGENTGNFQMTKVQVRNNARLFVDGHYQASVNDCSFTCDGQLDGWMVRCIDLRNFRFTNNLVDLRLHRTDIGIAGVQLNGLYSSKKCDGIVSGCTFYGHGLWEDDGFSGTNREAITINAHNTVTISGNLFRTTYWPATAIYIYDIDNDATITGNDMIGGGEIMGPGV